MKGIAKFLSGFLSAALAVNFAAPAVSECMAAADDTIASLSEVIKNGLENYQETIDISKFEIDPMTSEGISRISEVVQYVRKIPDMFCIGIEGSVKVKPGRAADGSIIAQGLMVTYNNTREEADALRSELNGKIDEIISASITPDMTELQKALKLHDYIVLNTVYDTKGELPDRDNGSSAYDILVCGNGVCEGYAQAYNMLLAKVDISSIMVTSYKMNHAWNLVNIDDEWYHVDTTWDDPVPDSQGLVNHKYFLLSDSEIRRESEVRRYIHDNWDSRGLEATSTKYDNAFWSTVGTEIFLQGDKWYFVSAEGEYTTYTESENTTNTFVSISDDKWMAWENDGSYWKGVYASLIISDGVVFYNTPTNIYRMNLDGSCKQGLRYVNPYDTNGYMYGMRLIDGKLYAVIKQSPNEEGYLHEVMDLALDDYSYVGTVLRAIQDLEDGGYQEFNMQDTEAILPKEAIECMKSKNVKISLDLGEYSWDISSENIKDEEAKDLNLEIRQDQGIIPEEMLSTISGSHGKCVELNLTHSGPFGLTANINYSLGDEFANNKAVLYYYNQAESKMDQVDFMMTDCEGNLQIDLEHASSYAVILRDINDHEDPIIAEEEKPPQTSEELEAAETAPEEITNPETSEKIESNIEVAPLLKGDINMDGIVDIVDLSLLSLACIREIRLSDDQLEAADVTHDSAVNLADLACMRQYLSNQIDKF